MCAAVRLYVCKPHYIQYVSVLCASNPRNKNTCINDMICGTIPGRPIPHLGIFILFTSALLFHNLSQPVGRPCLDFHARRRRLRPQGRRPDRLSWFPRVRAAASCNPRRWMHRVGVGVADRRRWWRRPRLIPHILRPRLVRRRRRNGHFQGGRSHTWCRTMRCRRRSTCRRRSRG